MAGLVRRQSEQGQIVVLMAGALLVVIGLVAIVVDGGNAWAQQRQTQNGTDAAAQAGATVLAQKLANDPTTSGALASSWDTAVKTAVANIASSNKIDPPTAYYTDICGILLTPSGAKATGTGDAAKIGSGFPVSAGTTPDCPAGVVGPVAGVEVHGNRGFGTYFARALGISSMASSAQATAVTGFVESCQSVELGCAVLPVTVPVWFSVCAGKDLQQNQGQPWPMNTTLVVPMCSNSPSNIGWIDWTPPNGGASEVVKCVLTPCNPAIPLPSWQYIAETGEVKDSQLENALNTWDGQVVLLPMFDHTCDNTPVEAQVLNVAAGYGCTTLDLGNAHEWYRLPRFAAFLLQHAYTNGNNLSECQNQAKSCLVGKFVRFVVSGTVGPGSGSGTTENSVIGVQLVK